MFIKRKIAEETILFFSISKWVLLSTVIGAIVGTAAAVFLKILNWSISFRNQFDYYYYLLPLAFLISVLLVKYLAPEAEGHGTEKVIEAIHKKDSNIDLMVVPVKLLATIVTIACGGSAGKEGPCAQIGAGLASYFANIFKFDSHDRRKLVICGISAGFASVFGTPLAGAIFGVEVLFVGTMLYDVLLPSFISGIMSYQVAETLGIEYSKHSANFVPVFSEIFFLKVVLAGIFFGICSIIFIETMNFFADLSSKIKLKKEYKAILGGFILIGLTFIFSDQFLGLGIETIDSCLPREKNIWYAFDYMGFNSGVIYSYLSGGTIVWYAFMAKILFTSITLSFGGSGGVVTPIFFIGATSGMLFAQLMGLDMTTFSAIGFVAVLAGSANTPIAASIMAMEILGAAIAPYASVACVVSFFMSGHRSIYPSQVLLLKKSESIDVNLGEQMDDISVKPAPRKKSFLQKILNYVNKNKS
ncbi:MAG TPA: chloride channel protein [Candidatus Wallbacteria bacterium]|nr:MAG: H(+)/Cl(-) exchange transporter ClcA [bacterium ADurb.Bin243]HPG56711.1 chloride channel protein [Candidatus Wallbacteria bacterium]